MGTKFYSIEQAANNWIWKECQKYSAKNWAIETLKGWGGGWGDGWVERPFYTTTFIP